LMLLFVFIIGPKVSVSSLVTYTNDTYRYSVGHPEKWVNTGQEDLDSETTVFVHKDVAGEVDAALTISPQEPDNEFKNLSQEDKIKYYDSFVEQLTKLEVQVFGKEHITINGQPAILIDHQAQDLLLQKEMRNVSVFFNNDTKSYFISCGSVPQLWTHYQPTCQKIIDSFQPL
jgi:hypothetical protein